MVAGSLREALTEHHWMALFAVEEEHQGEAVHHIDHIIELVTGDHLARMQQTRQMVEQGNLHEAGHIVKDMLSGTPSLELSSEEMHLRLALSSTRIEEAAEAAHHLEHYLAVASPDSEGAASAAEVMELLEAGDLADAEHELTELTGAAHEEGEAHEEGDEHTEGAEHEEGDEHTEGAEHEEGEAHVEGDEHGEK
jgi:hypothetical protein